MEYMIATIKNLIWRKPKVRTEVRLETKLVDLGDLTSDSWRRAPQNVAAANKLFNDPTLKMILAVMANETPMHDRVRPFGSSGEDVFRSYGEQTGYLHALAKLQSFALLIEDTKELEAEFKDDLK